MSCPLGRGLIPERAGRSQAQSRIRGTGHAALGASGLAGRTHRTRPHSRTPCRWADRPRRVPEGKPGPSKCKGTGLGARRPMSRPLAFQHFCSWASCHSGHTEGQHGPPTPHWDFSGPGTGWCGGSWEGVQSHETPPHKSLGLLCLSFLPVGWATSGCKGGGEGQTGKAQSYTWDAQGGSLGLKFPRTWESGAAADGFEF